MDLNEQQAASLEGLARASSERLIARVISQTEMREHLSQGAAEFAFGEFEGAPVRFSSRWWRVGAEGWEPLDDPASATLDADLERWKAACAAIGDEP
jgi:hypothetical protein